MKVELMSPLEASRMEAGNIDFYTAFPLREWALVKRIKQMSEDNICGELCSCDSLGKSRRNMLTEKKYFCMKLWPG